MKTLLVEDTVQLSKALSTVLRRNGHVVDCAFDGEEALEFIRQYDYDVIILDIMMPKKDGFEVLSIMRGEGNATPVIMLTARSSVDDKIQGLDLGADDYLAKPFSTEELLARLRALARRKPNLEDDTLTYGDLRLDRASCKLYCGERSTTLMNKEMSILVLLMESQGNIVSQDTISKSAWDVDAYSTSENVWVFISYLRKKMESIGSKTSIKSVRYRGYYLECADD